MAMPGSAALKNLVERSGWDYAVVWKLDESDRPIYHAGLYNWLSQGPAPYAYEEQCHATFFGGFTCGATAQAALESMQAQRILYPQSQRTHWIPSAAHVQFHTAARTQTILYIPGLLLQGKALLEMGTAQTEADFDILQALGCQFYVEEESWQQQMLNSYLADSPLLDLTGSPSSCGTDYSGFLNLQSELEDAPRVLQTRQESASPELVNQLQQILNTSSLTAPPATVNELPGSLPADRELQTGEKQKAKAHAQKEKGRRLAEKQATTALRNMLDCKKKTKASVLQHAVVKVKEMKDEKERLLRRVQERDETIKRKDEEMEKLRQQLQHLTQMNV